MLAVAFAPSRDQAQAQTHAKMASTAADEKAEINALEKRYMDAFNAKNVDAIMACYAPGKGLFVFDATPPREYPNWDAYKKDWEGLFAAFPGPVSQTMSEEGIVVAGSVAYGHNIQTGYFTDKAGTRTNLAVRVGDV